MSRRVTLLAASTSNSGRLKLTVRGAVQGVGFRPFIYRLATGLGLTGWINNSAQGVFLEVEGPLAILDQFLLRLEAEKPAPSFIQSLEPTWLDPAGYTTFEIRPSVESGPKTALVLPDIATCPDCLREVFDPSNRRHRYPFTNCTHCGPRFSILEALPYDRPNTSMKRFTMCPRCQAEYDDPRDRRFHAQPNACPTCGPHLELWDANGRGCVRQNAADSAENSIEPGSDDRSHEALLGAAQAIRHGRIVAVKGLGGFHLMVAAGNEEAVVRLRQLKHREEKPFALMFPSLEAVRCACEVSDLEARLLRSPEAPIVLLRRHPASGIRHPASALSSSVAPGNPCLGVMLPYTPLHQLLMAELGSPVVATSGNLSDEPICTDEHEAIERLRGIADLFLVHNRPIVRHVDDSIVRVVLGRELVLRRARGYAPLPIHWHAAKPNPVSPHPGPLPQGEGERHPATSEFSGTALLPTLNQVPPLPPGEGRGEGTREWPKSSSAGRSTAPPTILAVGAHLKNAVALAVGPQIFLSQHLGDLETAESLAAFRRAIADLGRLYDASPTAIACDLHPDYLSTKHARETGLPLVRVQHHYAHVLACMAENELEPPVLGVSWDGTGYGLDGTVWGGEFLRVTDTGFERVAHLRPFRLPGGDQAIREPRRVALGLLHEVFGDDAFSMADLPPLRASSAAELSAWRAMLARGLNSPWTSSAGRLFDAVASLAGLRQRTRFEGQAAMELEFAAHAEHAATPYPFELIDPDAAPLHSALRIPHSAFRVDWAPMLRAILEDLARPTPASLIAARFHATLVEMIGAVARRAGEPRVVLSGGCFQNQRLTEGAVGRLREEGFRVYWHQRVPPNDGGIALGQAVEALRALRRGPLALPQAAAAGDRPRS